MHGFESIIILRTVVEAHENIRAGQPGEISGQGVDWRIVSSAGEMISERQHVSGPLNPATGVSASYRRVRNSMEKRFSVFATNHHESIFPNNPSTIPIPRTHLRFRGYSSNGSETTISKH